MADEVLKHLYDVREAAMAIRAFTAGKSGADYEQDELLRSAVERKFEVIGEALGRIGRNAPGVLTQIREHRSIISFRNILAHGYDAIDDVVVWAILQDDLPALLADVNRLIGGSDGDAAKNSPAG